MEFAALVHSSFQCCRIPALILNATVAMVSVSLNAKLYIERYRCNGVSLVECETVRLQWCQHVKLELLETARVQSFVRCEAFALFRHGYVLTRLVPHTEKESGFVFGRHPLYVIRLFFYLEALTHCSNESSCSYSSNFGSLFNFTETVCQTNFATSSSSSTTKER